MPLFRVNYEEYLHYEEFIEAVDADEAKKQFENSISDLDPLEAEVYSYDVYEETGGHSLVGKSDDDEGFNTEQ